MSKQSERVKKWRKHCKERIIAAMGGSCCICGYNTCRSALALHHLDPSKKDFGFGMVMANPKNWESLVEELRKCVLVCHVCHCEIHEGLSEVPIDHPVFDEAYVSYQALEDKAPELLNECPVCKKLKAEHMITCSRNCAAKLLAEELNCSRGTIHKRLKKLGLK